MTAEELPPQPSWKPITVGSEHDQLRLRRHIGALVAVDDSEQFQAFGTVFVIGNLQDKVAEEPVQEVICVTAAHVLIGAAEWIEQPRHNLHMPDVLRPPPSFEYVGRLISERRLHVIFDGYPKPRACCVTRVSCTPLSNADLALLTVRLPDANEKVTGYFGVNSDWVQAGTKIIVQGRDSLSVVDKGGGSFEFASALGIRTGEIVEVLPRGQIVNAPLYRANIATAPGWSGGPVIIADPNGPERPMAAIGVISTGSGSFADPSAAADCYIIPSVWLYGVWLPWAFQKQAFGSLMLGRDLGKNSARIDVIANQITGTVKVKPPPPPLTSGTWNGS